MPNSNLSASMPERLRALARENGDVLAEKNVAYGSSFAVTGEFLCLLYPDEIKPEQYSDLGLAVRIFDKLMRIAHRKNAFGESPYLDIAGYGICGAAKDEIPESVSGTIRALANALGVPAGDLYADLRKPAYIDPRRDPTPEVHVSLCDRCKKPLGVLNGRTVHAETMREMCPDKELAL